MIVAPGSDILLLHQRGPVQDNRRRRRSWLAHTRSHQESLPVRSNVEFVKIGKLPQQPTLEEGLGRAEFKFASVSFHWSGHHRTISGNVEEFAAVVTPHGI